MTDPLLDAALALHHHGMNVLPILADGSKSPAISWKPWITTHQTETDVRGFFPAGHTFGLGVVQGAISGDLELTEIEGRATAALPDLKAIADASGLTNIWVKITTGWVEKSPSGGFHFHYRLTGTPVPGNTKLARDAGRLVLAETRGEGGQVVVAPTPGTHHPTGRAWTALIGGPATCPTLTRQERDQFHALLRTLDETPPPPEPATPAVPRQPGAGLSPGDDFEARTDWDHILQPHGWMHVTTRGDTRYWRRPGKDTGLSATTGHARDRDRLYVFTSSTLFDPERPYTKFGAYAALNHGGDHTAAARALAGDGYGQRSTALKPPTKAEPDHHTPATVEEPDRPATPDEDNTALIFVDEHEHEIRYCPGRGSWLVWNGYRWASDDNGHINELIRVVARRLPDDKEWARYRRSALSLRGVRSVAGLAATDHRIVAASTDLDARPYELNTPIGVIDLKTGKIIPSSPAGLHTRATSIAPDFTAQHPKWSAFLADTFAGDPAMSTYVQRLLGMSMCGVVLEQILPFCFGAGANGKSTLMAVAQRIVGLGTHGYSISAPASMLLATRNEGHPTELARLSGARLVVTSELEEGQRFAEAKIKLLTGKDTISGRFMGRDFFDFTPTHTLWLLANTQPAVKAGGVALWRRMRQIPFEHTVPPEARVADLEDQLVETEGPAILAWIVRGAVAYFEHGLAEPDGVRTATAAYERDQDSISRFVEEMCDTGPVAAQHMRVRSSEVRSAYETWCRAEGEDPVTVKAFVVGLRSRFGVVPERSSTTRYLAGIRLIDLPGDDTTDEDVSSDVSSLGGGSW